MKFLAALFGVALCGQISAELAEATFGDVKKVYNDGTFDSSREDYGGWKDIAKEKSRDIGYYEGEDFDTGNLGILGHNVGDASLEGIGGERRDLIKIGRSAGKGNVYDYYNKFNKQSNPNVNRGINRKHFGGTPKNDRFYLGNLRELKNLVNLANVIGN